MEAKTTELRVTINFATGLFRINKNKEWVQMSEDEEVAIKKVLFDAINRRNLEMTKDLLPEDFKEDA